MTVRELIKALLDQPLDAQAYVGKGMGPAMMFALAIHDYAGGIPASQMVLNVALPRFVAALVDDEQARQETLACL